MKKLMLFLLIAGCGFVPMYSERNTDIYVSPIQSGANGIELRNALNAKFGGQKDASAPYVLEVSLSEPITKYKALDQTGVATWQEVLLNASYTLKAGDTVIASGTESSSESYSFVQYLVAANASYNNAVNNTIIVLSEKIGNRAIAEVYKHSHGDK
ncbi:MAG: hypothetical protein J5679_03125 [Alphaproteobacteria bacterium]|nr:hypothetical protein [Alphaproteobacteria bacterium]